MSQPTDLVVGCVVFATSVGSAMKQTYWILVCSKEPMYTYGSIIISLFNIVNNSLNTLLFTLASSNPTYASAWSLYVGTALYATGILIEPIAETQRLAFKNDPANAGKPYGGGLFGSARNINYGAYTVWHGGYALAYGGPVWGALATASFAYNFANRAIPVLEEYCQKKYKDDWKRVVKDVPYRLTPSIY